MGLKIRQKEPKPYLDLMNPESWPSVWVFVPVILFQFLLMAVVALVGVIFAIPFLVGMYLFKILGFFGRIRIRRE